MICCPPTARRCSRQCELGALEGDRGALRGGGIAQHRLGGGVLSGRDDGGAVLDDARLDRGDLGDRLAQAVGVVEVDRGEDRDIAVGAVRRVPRAAHADLEHEHVDRGVGERDEREHREQFEEGEPRVVARRQLGVDEVDERRDLVPRVGDRGVGDGLAVDHDALGEALQMRAREQAGPQAVGAHETLDHAAGRRLAVRAR